MPSLARYISSEQLRLNPIQHHKDSVARREAHYRGMWSAYHLTRYTLRLTRKIGAPPKQIRQRPSARKVPAQPAHIRHRPLAADICQTPLVAVLKRPNLLHASQLLLQSLNLREDLIPRLWCGGFRLRDGEVSELIIEFLGLGKGVEEPCEESSFLRSNLCSRRIVGNSAVADGPHVLGAINDENIRSPPAHGGNLSGPGFAT